MWLRDRDQWEGHRAGKKHKKNTLIKEKQQKATHEIQALAMMLATKWLREHEYRRQQVHIRLGLRLARIKVMDTSSPAR